MFWKRNPKSPITKEDETWIIDSCQWFEETFTIDLSKQEIILPGQDLFSSPYTGSEENVNDIVDFVADKLSISSSASIEVYFYEEFQLMDFTDEGVYSNYEEGTELSHGKYLKLVDGVYQIGLEKSLLDNPEQLIATIAHEVTHIKLLGEEVITENDEPLTDLVASLYGFVIFLANGSISVMSTWSGSTHTGWSISGASGYLHYKIYAFLIAYWIKRKENIKPDWLGYLNKDIQREVRKATKYLNAKK